MVVWHANHHLRLGVSIPEAYELIGPYVRHCHINEGPGSGQPSGGKGPIPLGSGDGNVVQVAQILKGAGYGGVLSGEWINGGLIGGKSDLSSIVDPREILGQYGSRLREYQAYWGE